MPTCARRDVVRPGEPGIFHCWARCVRRAWLLGTDPYTGKDYNHRRQWVLARLELLVANFAIDVGFFATMSNHLHLVLRAVPRLVQRMGDQEVARRWLHVYPGQRVLDENWIEPTLQQVEALAKDKARLQKIRRRLSNISWFMGALSEYIARRSNLEDEVTGRFWEGRFCCREITTEGALLICGLYVDLNQIRAGEAVSPYDSAHTSVGLRLRAQSGVADCSAAEETISWLAPLSLRDNHLGDVPSTSGRRASDKGLLPLSLADYVRLLTYTAQAEETAEETTTRLPAQLASEVERLAIDPDKLVDMVRTYPGRFRRLVGAAPQLVQRAAEAGRRWFQGVRQAAQVFR